MKKKIMYLKDMNLNLVLRIDSELLSWLIFLQFVIYLNIFEV
jgi:hypothetical protein